MTKNMLAQSIKIYSVTDYWLGSRDLAVFYNRDAVKRSWHKLEKRETLRLKKTKLCFQH